MYAEQIIELFLTLPVGIQTVVLSLLAMFGLHIINAYLSGNRLSQNYGLKPRQSNRLLTPILAHLLHANWRHLLSNSLPFLVLGGLIAQANMQSFWIATAAAMIVGGLGTWLMGASGAHLGASGLVTGYFGFVLGRGFFTQNSAEILIAILVGAVYFGLFRTVFGRRKGASNVMHLFGFAGGILGAWINSLV